MKTLMLAAALAASLAIGGCAITGSVGPGGLPSANPSTIARIEKGLDVADTAIAGAREVAAALEVGGALSPAKAAQVRGDLDQAAEAVSAGRAALILTRPGDAEDRIAAALALVLKAQRLFAPGPPG